MKYFVLAKLGTSTSLPSNTLCFWWLPNGSGYTAALARAARYSEGHARAIAKASGGTAFAIPIALAEKGGRYTVPADEYDDLIRDADEVPA